ncbi:hemolysin-III related-domain-containing protein [Dunaliella salina]|uniref:Hemolysin-III related-domain-containing protein n=1 Tax=Dunaliella salina TaxID=3046 RepID=A0ABQ7GAZ0_DUNSA|nr:hemolysin-III related-domain-containing protein [Dunaliella salina]|eukprot:KAF5831771.1 hemolysin-III related-domain-containing protein [Dunaliella salina]
MQNHMHLLANHLEDALAGVFSYPTPRWPVYVFCAGAMTCLLFSSVCHLLGCCQKHITQRVWRLDYTGIAVLIVTSFYPPVYYGFMCAPIW